MNRYSRVLLSACLGILTLGYVSRANSSTVVDRIVVTVNNDFILESDIEKFRQKMRSKSYQELFGGLDENALKSREAVLQLLIEERLINQQVKKLELTANEQEVEGQIRSIAKRNNISQAQLAERLKQLGTTMNDYKDAIRRQLERKNLVDREIKPSTDGGDEPLRHFYMRNANSQDSETQYKIAHLLIENKKRDGLSGEARAKKVYDEMIKKPGDFATFVAQYSDDASTVETEGVLGDFSSSQLAKEFREIVPRTGIGQLTPPIQTGMGYHIVKVLEKKSGDFNSLSKERKEALRGQMIGAEMEKKMGLWLERLKADSHIKVFTNASK